jgi:hypothetical protein
LRESHAKNDNIAAPSFRQFFVPSRPSKRLETFANPTPQRDYRIHMEIPEFTCLCPMTGQPDFATMRIRYVPDQHCVELVFVYCLGRAGVLWSSYADFSFKRVLTRDSESSS